MGPKSNLMICTACCVAFTWETFRDHDHPHALDQEPILPLESWGVQGMGVMSSASASIDGFASTSMR